MCLSLKEIHDTYYWDLISTYDEPKQKVTTRAEKIASVMKDLERILRELKKLNEEKE